MTFKNTNRKTFKYKVEESFKKIDGSVDIKTTRYKTTKAITDEYGIARCSIYKIIKGGVCCKYSTLKIFKISEPALVYLDE